MGAALPCGEGTAPQGSVIILSAEDGDADTICPRLHAAGADLGRVHITKMVTTDNDGGRRGFSLQTDIGALERLIEEKGDVLLVIIDPISSYFGRGVDSHKNTDVRGVLAPLTEMAERTGVALVSVTHFSKAYAGNVPKAAHRFIGSIAFVAAPRIAFVVLQDGDSDRRLLLHAKNNLAPAPQGLAFCLKQTIVGVLGRAIVTSRVEWESDPVDITASEAMAAEGTSKKEKPRAAAEAFLRALLASGPVLSTKVKEDTEAAGLAWATVRRAQEELGIVPYQENFGGPWFWALGARCSGASCSDAQKKEVSNWTESEQLGDASCSDAQKKEVSNWRENEQLGDDAALEDARAAFEERAAIREYNGELTREEAELAAADELCQNCPRCCVGRRGTPDAQGILSRWLFGRRRCRQATEGVGAARHWAHVASPEAADASGRP